MCSQTSLRGHTHLFFSTHGVCHLGVFGEVWSYLIPSVRQNTGQRKARARELLGLKACARIKACVCMCVCVTRRLCKCVCACVLMSACEAEECQGRWVIGSLMQRKADSNGESWEKRGQPSRSCALSRLTRLLRGEARTVTVFSISISYDCKQHTWEKDTVTSAFSSLPVKNLNGETGK